MLDINIEAEKALSETGFNTVFHYPQKMDTLPVVSFYTVSETGEMSADNREMFRNGVIGVDVFAQAPIQCGEMAEKINEALSHDGWSRIYAMDIPEDTDGVFHKAMRFTKSFFVWE